MTAQAQTAATPRRTSSTEAQPKAITTGVKPGGATKASQALAKTHATAKPQAAHKAAHKAAKKLPKLRIKLVRDSFAMPESDFAVIATLKSTALGARRAVKKSELLRAGLRMLATLDAGALVAACDGLEPVKTGRPKKSV
jgi:hypothetical protein